MKFKLQILLMLISFATFSQEKVTIYFDFDKSELNDFAVKKLNSWIAEGKNYEVTKLFGFCDWKGTNSYNDTLAMKRVLQVYEFLKASKINVQKDIEIRGFGEDFEQSKLQAENRRVTIVYIEKNETTGKKEVIIDENLSDQIKKSKKGDLIKLNNIYFFNNSAKTVPKSEPILYELLCAMNDNPTLNIEIQGHICCKRPDEFDAISTARAKAVYNYLIRNKIDRSRMSFKGYGVTKPIYLIPEKNETEENFNRRVEILIKNK